MERAQREEQQQLPVKGPREALELWGIDLGWRCRRTRRFIAKCAFDFDDESSLLPSTVDSPCCTDCGTNSGASAFGVAAMIQRSGGG